MLRTIDIEVFLSCAYSVFLVLVAFSLELAARYSHHRSKQVRLSTTSVHIRSATPSRTYKRTIWNRFCDDPL